MNNKYLRNKLIQVNCPIIHVGSYLKKDVDLNGVVQERHLSLVFKNISLKKILAIKGIIYTFDPFNEKLDSTEFKLVEIENFEPGKLHGENVFFKVHKDAVNFKVEINIITYEEFELEEFNSIEYVKLEENANIQYHEEKKYIMMKLFNREYIQDLIEDQYFYQCVCGSINHIKNNICINCMESKSKFKETFEIENVKKIIEEDSKEISQNTLKNTKLSFEITNEELAALIFSEGYVNTKEKVSEVKNKYITLMKLINKDLSNEDKTVLKLIDLENRVKNVHLGLSFNLDNDKDIIDIDLKREFEIYIENNKNLGENFDKGKFNSQFVNLAIHNFENNIKTLNWEKNEVLIKYLEYIDNYDSIKLLLLNEIKVEKNSIWDLLYYLRSLKDNKYLFFANNSKYYLRFMRKLKMLGNTAGKSLNTDQLLLIKIHEKSYLNQQLDISKML